MKALLGCLTLVLLGWLVAMLWAIYVATVYTLALCRLRATRDDILGDLHVAREMRQAEQAFGDGIDGIDDAYHLSRPRRHRVDAGAPSWKGGSSHAGA